MRGAVWITKPITPDPRDAANGGSINGMALPYARDVDITVRVNGRAVRAVVQPRTTLLDWLREEVGLTGDAVAARVLAEISSDEPALDRA